MAVPDDEHKPVGCPAPRVSSSRSEILSVPVLGRK
jgi:hypothetical protein